MVQEHVSSPLDLVRQGFRDIVSEMANSIQVKQFAWSQSLRYEKVLYNETGHSMPDSNRLTIKRFLKEQ